LALLNEPAIGQNYLAAFNRGKKGAEPLSFVRRRNSNLLEACRRCQCIELKTEAWTCGKRSLDLSDLVSASDDLELMRLRRSRSAKRDS